MHKRLSIFALLFLLLPAVFFSTQVKLNAQTSSSQTLTLKTGFNFVSFTLQSYLSPQKLMELNTKITNIYSYNAAAGSFISASDGALSSIAPAKGYIVKANADAYLNTSGIAAGTLGDISLKSGFNLVGFSKPVTAATFSSLMNGYSIIKGMYKWNAASGAFMQVVRSASGVVELLDGVDPSISNEQAYFINVTSDTTLNYDGGSIIIGAQAPVTPVVKSLGMITLSRPSIAAAISSSTDLASSVIVNAVYTDGTSVAVNAAWKIKSGGGSLSGTVYTAPSAAATAILTATYSEGGVTKTTDLTVSAQTASYVQGAENIANSLSWKWTDPGSDSIKIESANRIDITVSSNRAFNEIYDFNAPRYTKSVTGDFAMYARGFPNPFVAQSNGLGLIVEDPNATGASRAASNAIVQYTYTSGIKFASMQLQNVIGKPAFIDLHDIYFKLERIGNKFTGYVRDPNVSEWTQVGEATINLPAAIDAGIILINQSNPSKFSAYFTDFSIYSLTSAVSNSVSELTLSKTSDAAAAGSPYDLSLITATTKYSNGTSKTVTPSWDVLIGSGSLANGKYTVQGAAENDVLRASYTENGVSVCALLKLTIGGTTPVNTGFENTYTADGSASLPAGSQTMLTDLTAYTNISSTRVLSDGSFNASIGADTGITIAAVIMVNKNGNPAMMKLAALSGGKADSEPISAVTTADALVLFDPNFYMLGSGDFQKAKALLASHASRAELVSLIENSIKTDPAAPLDGNTHKDIYEKAVAISTDILNQMSSSSSISSAGRAALDGTDINKDIYIEDDSDHNTPYVNIINKTYCYYDVKAYNTGQLNSFNFLPKCEVLPKLVWSWPPDIASSTRNEIYMGDGDLEFHFTKNRELSLLNTVMSIVSLAIGKVEIADNELKTRYEAAKIATGAVATFIQKWINSSWPSTKKEAVLMAISLVSDLCPIAYDIVILIRPSLKDKLLNIEFVKNAFAILKNKLTVWGYASTAFSVADITFSMWSLANAEAYFDYYGRQEKGYYPKPAADSKNKTIDIGGGVMMDFIYIKAGVFMMGSPSTETGSTDNERPVHQVTLTTDFLMGKYEVTQKQWTTIMGTNPSPADNPIGDNYPVHKINSDDCLLFVSGLNKKALGYGTFKLPTEAQWEYACRAGSTTPYYFATPDLIDSCAWYSNNSKIGSPTAYAAIHIAGQKTPNAFGLYDMSGNVKEFCSDTFAGASYTTDAAIDPAGESGAGLYSSRVLRGGNYMSNASACRSASRSYALDEMNGYRGYGNGVRIVLMPVQ